MEKSIALVVEDDNLVREILMSYLNEFGYNVKGYSSEPPTFDYERAALCLIDINLGADSPDGFDIARRIKSFKSSIPVFMITGLSGKRRDKAIDSFLKKPVEGFLSKPLKIGDLEKVLSDNQEKLKLREKELSASKEPLNLGVIGLGAYGQGIISRAAEQDFVKQINIFSPSKKGNYGSIPEALHSEKNNWCDSIEDFLKSNPSLIYIASGVPAIKKENNKIYVKNREELFEETALKLMPTLSTIRNADYDRLIIIGANPIEQLLLLAKEIGFNPYQITGGSVTDSIRMRKILNEWELAIRGKLDVLGTHSNPIPILSVHGISKKSWENLKSQLREFGKYAVKGVSQGGLITDAPEGAIEQIKDIFDGAKYSTSCWPVYLEDINAFLSQPVRIINGKNLRASILPKMETYEQFEWYWQKTQGRQDINRINAFLNKYGTRRPFESP